MSRCLLPTPESYLGLSKEKGLFAREENPTENPRIGRNHSLLKASGYCFASFPFSVLGKERAN